ncbi:ABC transporter permease [Tabrizicola sp.]|uniref:ABC transporter permease n=1 Tax=Tabrizicola sp. TaxID=2005166 RepID=UPI0035B4BBD9
MTSGIPQGRRTGGLVSAVLSLAAFLALWAIVAALVAEPITMPGPMKVGTVLMDELASGRLISHTGITLLRVIAAFVVAMAIGVALGLVLGRSRTTDTWVNPWLVILVNMPALVVTVLCYIWIGLNEVAAVAAVVINKVPLVTVMVREGARALRPDLDDMARIFRMTPSARLRHVVLPQMAPYIAGAARAGLSLIWKIVLVVEFLGRSSGVGFQIHLNFSMFRVAHILAYAFAFILVMLVIEYLILRPLERHAGRWRQDGH